MKEPLPVSPQDQIRSIQKIWICVDKMNNPDRTSITFKRTESISMFVVGTSFNWRQWKTMGARCIKVDIDFTVIK